MKKIITTAIFLMAMTSASIAFGQGTGFGGTNNQSYRIPVYVKAIDPTTNINNLVDNATLTYRFYDGNSWQDWEVPKHTYNVYGGLITFDPVYCSYTSGDGQKIEYIVRAYSGTNLISSTCGIESIGPDATEINITTWNGCLGATPHEYKPNDGTE